MKVVAFLPAKGSSSRIDSKNLKLLDGKPLFLHTLEKLCKCDFIDDVYLDSESEEILSYAKGLGCKFIKRDPSLASNSTDGHSLFMNEVMAVEADIYIQILGTSPFIEAETIRTAVEKLTLGSEYDSVVLVRKEKQYTWDSDKKPNYTLERIPNSVDLPDTIIETMGLYVVRREAAIKTKRRIGEKPYLIDATALEAVDVNWPDDFELANLIAAGQRESQRKTLANIRGHFNSCLLSDLLDDLGFKDQVVKGLTMNITGAKILGRAKTLKLRKLEEGEDFKGIYNALFSYNSIIPGDVIVVENEISDFAYFGELNANLALRCGASGVIVGGMTRDSDAVRRLGLPVVAQGSTCQDVRGRATMEAYNCPIKLGNVPIQVDDLIFADNEGTIVIPKKIEKKVVDEVLKRAAIESRILVDIAEGVNVNEIVSSHGFF